MRIISGKFKSRRINAPANLPIRPTTDFAKEGLFNVLNNDIDFTEVAVLDLYAGTGSISFEFLSRGCKEATAVELNQKCIDFMHKTKQLLLLENFYVVKADVKAYMNHCRKTFDVIFADPPYEIDGIADLLAVILEKNLLKAGGLLILEHSARNDFKEHPLFSEQRNYGKVNFTFFKI
jgi:16S rRNA (guanine966-N2)-methyltransferase